MIILSHLKLVITSFTAVEIQNILYPIVPTSEFVIYLLFIQISFTKDKLRARQWLMIPYRNIIGKSFSA